MSTPLPTTPKERSAWFAKSGGSGGLNQAIASGAWSQPITLSLCEALILGLMRQGVTKYLMILGHGSTELGEMLRIYEEAGLVKGFQFRNEVEMAHAGTALRWVYHEPCAVVTSIGPGALQALAGSLAAASNGVGLYHIYGDETTHGEGYNMQQIPKPEQGLFGQLTATMGASYTLYTPDALRDALRRGVARVFHPYKPGPFYLNLPLNIQPAQVTLRLDALPTIQLTQPAQTVRPAQSPALLPHDHLSMAVKQISDASRVAVKVGGGARYAADALKRFIEKSGSVAVLSPGSTGVLPDSHSQNMHVGGSKGSISGNFAMGQANLVIFVGSRAVCQSDCSGVGWPQARSVININPDINDVQHYNQSLTLVGDAESILNQLAGFEYRKDNKVEWLKICADKKAEWHSFKTERYLADPIEDEVWKVPVLTQPQVIHIADQFSREVGAIKFFDAGDVQANGFQVVEDDHPGETFTESGASYMGFSVSALLSGGIADQGRYSIAFSGDGSFMMNPQVLIDGVEHGVHATILLMDNRRMAAISQLQLAQYGKDYRTNDAIAVDYVQMAKAVKGVEGFWGGTNLNELQNALKKAHAYQGLSLIHVPVYSGPNPLGGMGAYGKWNVGNWCAEVQREYKETLI